MHHPLLQHLAFFAAAVIASALSIPASAQYCSANNQSAATTTRYPTKCQIAQLFNYPNQVDLAAFFAQALAPDVHWTLMGTHPLAGEYRNRTIFLQDTVERLGNTLVAGTATLSLVHVVGGGEEEWSVQELHGTGVCKNGNLIFSFQHRCSIYRSFVFFFMRFGKGA